MKIALVTDAWQPQVNGVVTTLVELVQGLRDNGHEVLVVHPGLFKTRPCPGYAGIDLAIGAGRTLPGMLDIYVPDAVHLATEGPLGWAARRHCLRRRWAFTTAFHTKFPEILQAAFKLPLCWGYALFRRFHRPSSGVMVPTQGALQMLQRRGFTHLRAWTHGVDTKLFAYAPQARIYPALGPVVRPVSLFVGRVSYEKNIEHFLQMNIPGTKVVCGVGPLMERLQAKYPHVFWVGLLQREALSQLYASADVFVFPSTNETFGLVLLEAMACGTPVAAFRVDGPMEVLGAQQGAPQGGMLHVDLHQAWEAARKLPRHEARLRALCFSWEEATERFMTFLVPAQADNRLIQPPVLSSLFHKTVT
jgi:glycosyltransferase involved in cell wall biosynthesis